MENLTKTPGVYLITSPNGKQYVGRTRNLHTRREQYKYSTASGGNRFLKEDIRSYGFEKFKFEVLEYLPIDTTRENLDKKERYYINKLQTQYPDGYNLTKGGVVGYKVHEAGIHAGNKDKKFEPPVPVVLYNIYTGERLGEFPSITAAAKEYKLPGGCLSSISKGKAKSIKGITVFRKEEDPGEIEVSKIKRKLPIILYNIEDETFQEFRNKQELFIRHNITVRVINNHLDKSTDTSGRIFVTKTRDWKEKIERIISSKKDLDKVSIYKNGEFIREFSDIEHAFESLKQEIRTRSLDHFIGNIKGKQSSTPYGYTWVFNKGIKRTPKELRNNLLEVKQRFLKVIEEWEAIKYAPKRKYEIREKIHTSRGTLTEAYPEWEKIIKTLQEKYRPIVLKQKKYRPIVLKQKKVKKECKQFSVSVEDLLNVYGLEKDGSPVTFKITFVDNYEKRSWEIRGNEIETGEKIRIILQDSSKKQRSTIYYRGVLFKSNTVKYETNIQ